MTSAPSKGFPLILADEGVRVRILRLTELGLNVGSEIQVMQRQGGGLLIARGETRIALGAGMASKILVTPLS